MKPLGLFVTCGALVVALSEVADIGMLVKLPSALIVMAVGLGAALFGHGPEGLELLPRALRASERANCSGVLGSLIGGMAMLANVSDPSTIGPAIAVALLTVLYGDVTSTPLWMPTERRMRSLAMKGSTASATLDMGRAGLACSLHV
jgi:flagellar motor component MotA